MVVDAYESIDEAGNFGYEITYWSESGYADDTIVDSHYGFKSDRAAEKAGNAALKKLNTPNAVKYFTEKE